MIVGPIQHARQSRRQLLSLWLLHSVVFLWLLWWKRVEDAQWFVRGSFSLEDDKRIVERSDNERN